MTAPFFTAWAARLGRRTNSLRLESQRERHATLSQIERTFESCLPSALFVQRHAHAHSRERIYTLSRTFWGFLWQILQHNTSCREVVRQLQACCLLHDAQSIDDGTSAYCQARSLLPADVLQSAFNAVTQEAQKAAPTMALLGGRDIKVVDGTSLQLPDTAANQSAFPQSANQAPGCGFPHLKLLCISSLKSGAVLAHHIGSKHTAERRALQDLLPHFTRGDVMLGDRAYGHFIVAVLLAGAGVDLIASVPTGVRHIDWRKGKRLGPHDRLVVWKKPSRPAPGFTPDEWAALPTEKTLRLVQKQITQPGFRPMSITLVTTLLDPALTPAAELFEVYCRRWQMEMWLDDMKTTLGMNALHCRTPGMVRKELLVFLIAHNLLRWTIAKAARSHAVEPTRISFKGTLDALRQFQNATAQVRSAKQRQQLWRSLLLTLASDLVPLRPGRREPRAVKKRPKYPTLARPRNQQRDRPHYRPHLRKNSHL